MLEQALKDIGQLSDLEKDVVLKTLLSKETLVVRLRTLLAIEDDSQDYLLDYMLDSIRGRILRYINWPCLPEELEPVLLSMTVSYYKQSGIAPTVEGEQEVTSVKRGDVTVSYGASSLSKSNAFNIGDYGNDFLGWRSVLNEYRRLRFNDVW